MNKKNLIVFGNSSSFITNILFEGTLKSLGDFNEIDKVVFIDASTRVRRLGSLLKHLYYLISYGIDSIYIDKKDFKSKILEKCREYNIPFIVPLNYDINTSWLRKKIKEFQPAIAILIGCPQIMQKELIACFDRIINYHNSILPKYRGIYATHWARYFHEPTTGYSFHIVNENIDDGNIIFQSSFKDNNQISVLDMDIIKAQDAALNINIAIDALLKNKAGQPQFDVGSYFGKKELRNIITINDTTVLDYREIKRRIDIFSLVIIKNSHNRYLFINNVERIDLPCNKPKFFESKDKICFKVIEETGIKKIYHKLKFGNSYRFIWKFID